MKSQFNQFNVLIILGENKLNKNGKKMLSIKYINEYDAALSVNTSSDEQGISNTLMEISRMCTPECRQGSSSRKRNINAVLKKLKKQI